MKVNIDTLKDTFKFAWETFDASRQEADYVMNLYHNRQYTEDQLQLLYDRGQPRETFNIIKAFGRQVLGYCSTIVNAVKVEPAQQQDVVTANVLNDLVSYIFRTNNFMAESEKMKLDLLISGMMCSYVDVEELPTTDQFGRPKYKINISHVPVSEIVLDPMSRLEDYSDARFIHRFKWVSEEFIAENFGKHYLGKLDEYRNFVNQNGTEFEKMFAGRFVGYSKQYNAYQLIHTVMKDDNGHWYEVYWCGETILQKEKITFKEVKSPYRVHKIHTSNNKVEYYGVFREVVESQHAINQAIIKIQLLVNSQQIYYQEGSIENEQEVIDSVNRLNSIIKVKDLEGIKVEKLTRDIRDQYEIIDRALNRVQRILSINDSFLGMSYASESGAKVKIQQNASITALRYIVLAIEQFYQLLGSDILNLVKQYYTFSDVINISDEFNSQKFLEINKPLMVATGEVDQMGQPVMQPVYEEYRDPASGEIKPDMNGQIILVPMPTSDTDIAFTDADVKVVSVAYNDEDERVRMLLEQFLSGPLGQMLSQVNPAGYFEAGAMAIRETKAKYSEHLAQLLLNTSAMLSGGQNPEALAMMQQGMAAGQEKPKSTSNDQTGR